MAEGVKAYLKRRLGAGDFERLERASRGFTLPLFRYDSELKRYECALPAQDWEDGDAGGPLGDAAEVEKTLDAIFAACDLLSECTQPLAWDLPSPVEEEQAGGEMTIDLTFGPGEEEAARRFMRLLEENLGADAGIQSEFQKYPGGFCVRLVIRYGSDFEYDRKKQCIDWLLDVAKRRAGDIPFRGARL